MSAEVPDLHILGGGIFTNQFLDLEFVALLTRLATISGRPIDPCRHHESSHRSRVPRLGVATRGLLQPVTHSAETHALVDKPGSVDAPNDSTAIGESVSMAALTVEPGVSIASLRPKDAG